MSLFAEVCMVVGGITIIVASGGLIAVITSSVIRGWDAAPRDELERLKGRVRDLENAQPSNPLAVLSDGHERLQVNSYDGIFPSRPKRKKRRKAKRKKRR